MQIRDLGELSGPVWLCGGAYSNAHATRALLARAAEAGARVIFTGDAVGYGAEPLAVLEMLAGRVEAIAGNVERQLAAGAADCGCGFAPGSTCARLSEGWYAHADRLVGRRWRRWMAELPDIATFTHAGRRFAVIHGGVSDISRFLWPCSKEADFRGEIDRLETLTGPIDGVIAGHAGLAFERRIGAVHWINAGAIGLPPHDGRPATRHASLHRGGARFHRLAYDHQAAARAMRAAGLTQGYDLTLQSGLWPSEDILPASLRRKPA